MNVRPLQTKDLFRVVRIIRDASPAVREAMSGAVTRKDVTVKGKQATQVQIDKQALGFAIFEAIAGQDTLIVELLADLAGMDVPTFEETPPDTVLDVVAALLEGNDLQTFLSKAMGLASKASSAL